ncbi:TetR/AcrR family transcriptional regulator [Paenibacillus naphthalenovorans]|uniref:TetR family transcriptional regulator n=1 Tax=Paenibacillus naphthalenovorans TaxID=162209 RepID=A0A0U2W5M2_9BACL|nr:TetR/AcrR family transcriptional regulator [Paenibacillus naphthalenovorans]ALS23860.1 TetR family transcriptional regulator [Paenibacillus naphthalenovorans]GCL72092.1 TetR/AcrR family transcriptional regulator [Paenibacillus naphthalenovorans]SDI97897.1 DNA-binding transcriptional regulator, AcrR family [Paenibacillus naphthalenovorans]
MRTDFTSLDRRIYRTRLMIQESLISLILEKGFERISVKDIADHANVNRSTFYAHYQDKFDLLDTIIEEKLALLSKLFKETGPQVESRLLKFDEPDPYFVVLFNYMADSARFYKVMFTFLEQERFKLKMQEVIREALYDRISRLRMEQKLSVPLDIVLDYASSSVMGVAENWVKKDIIYSPHHMALQLTRLASLGIYKAIGMEDNGRQN